MTLPLWPVTFSLTFLSPTVITGSDNVNYLLVKNLMNQLMDLNEAKILGPTSVKMAALAT